MQRLRPEKLLTIIASSVLESTLIEIVRKHGVSGYTIVQASGAGTSGVQSGMLDIDTNILMHIVLPESRVSVLLDQIEHLMHRGHHLKVFVSDIGVLTRKGEA